MPPSGATSAPAKPPGPPPPKPPPEVQDKVKKLTAKERSLFGEGEEEEAETAAGGLRGGRSKLDSLFGDDDEAESGSGALVLL